MRKKSERMSERNDFRVLTSTFLLFVFSRYIPNVQDSKGARRLSTGKKTFTVH